jgi:hypothetical protein
MIYTVFNLTVEWILLVLDHIADDIRDELLLLLPTIYSSSEFNSKSMLAVFNIIV